MNELEKAICQLKLRKSPGLDHIHPEFIKHLDNTSKLRLLTLYNMGWKMQIPAVWEKATISPILKKRKLANTTNSCRLIVLTSVIVKNGNNDLQ